MSANVCPTCKAPIDPARAPVARVRGDRVVTFCSVACADAARAATPQPARQPDRPADAGAPGAGHKVGHKASQKAGHKADQTAGETETQAAAQTTHGYEAPQAPAAPGNRKRRIIALSSAILVGGMVATIINAVSPSAPSDVSAASSVTSSAAPGAVASGAAPAETHPDTAPQGTEPPPPAPLDPKTLHDRALAMLHQLMESPSPRVQRLGATPLARTGDAAALAHLTALMKAESSDLGRIELAYALARSGDESGRKLLVEALENDRRDVRLYAARHLVQLRDDAGTRVLRRMLSLRNHRIEAAGLLARMGDQQGFEALREELADEDTSSEQKMRLAVALGRAGDESVKPQLLEILQNEEARTQHVGAAEALAALRDRAAVPALVHQLDVHALRVGAALALRRLGERGDTVALDGLAAALETGPEDARASAAEAILLLVGPETLAELD